MKLKTIIEKIDVWDDWLSAYKSFVPKFIVEAKTKTDWKDWDPKIFHEFFEKSAGQCVSSLKQGYFTGEEKNKLKDNWSSISGLLKKIAENQTEPNWDNYAELKRIIRRYTSQDRKASTNRLIAALQPELLCTIVNEHNLYELFRYLKKAEVDDVPQNNGGNWFKNSYALLQFFKAQLPEYKHLDIITYPWQTREYLMEPANNQGTLNLYNMKIADLLLKKKQIILQGAPGTGKTYTTAELALRIINGNNIDSNNREELMEAYQKGVKEGQIVFTTFHQSLDYEEFIEGFKPGTEEGQISYDIEPGTFKALCQTAKVQKKNNFEECYKKITNDLFTSEKEYLKLKTLTGKTFGVSLNQRGNLNLFTGSPLKKQGSLTKEILYSGLNDKSQYEYWFSYYKGVVEYLKSNYGLYIGEEEKKNYVLIIDEINRGNISKIFGELITLLEADKRMGQVNEIKCKLPYSNEEFSVPDNLFIIGTMNTTDRSLGHIDYAVRRRFGFVTLESDIKYIKEYYNNLTSPVEGLLNKAEMLYHEIEKIVKDNSSPEFLYKDIMVGHSYFMAASPDELELKLEYEIKPLLVEYIKDGILTIRIDDINDLLNNLEC